MKQVVQGDILFVEVDKLPTDMVPEATKVVARGEKTGHAHVIDGMGQLYLQRNFNGMPNQRFLTADEDISIRHEEHGAAELPKGVYEIKEQRIHDYEAVAKRLAAERRVVD